MAETYSENADAIPIGFEKPALECFDEGAAFWGCFHIHRLR
jgi:hypothetical protein